jgi:hypothetical protein
MFRVKIGALLASINSTIRDVMDGAVIQVRQRHGRHSDQQSREIAILASILDPPHTEAPQWPNDAGRGNGVFSACHAPHQACGGASYHSWLTSFQTPSHPVDTLWRAVLICLSSGNS